MFDLIALTRIIALTLILIVNQPVFASNNYRITSPIKTSYQTSTIPNKAGMRELSNMEQNMFGRSFTNETQAQRVSRLEREIFGMNQPGDLNSRFDNLRAGYRGYRHPAQCQTSSYQKPNYIYPPNYYQTPIIQSGGGLRGFFNNLGNFMMGGTPTGLSPQINPSYGFDDDFYTSSSGYSKGFTSNRGYGYHNTNTGGGVGVTILD